MPPGCLPTLWQNDKGFIESYLTEYPGYYKTADAGDIDEDGYVFVMSPYRRHHQRCRPQALHGRN